MTNLTTLRNIGEKMEKRLHAIGISTAEKLIKVGAKEAFVRLKSHDPSVCVVYLYTLEGAILDTEYNLLPEDVKEDLRQFCNGLK